MVIKYAKILKDDSLLIQDENFI